MAKQTARRDWTTRELKFLVANAKKMSMKLLADVLNRNVCSVFYQLNKYGIPYRRERKYRYWTTSEAKKMLEMKEEGKTFSEIASILGRRKSNCVAKYGEIKKTKETVRQVSE